MNKEEKIPYLLIIGTLAIILGLFLSFLFWIKYEGDNEILTWINVALFLCGGITGIVYKKIIYFLNFGTAGLILIMQYGIS